MTISTFSYFDFSSLTEASYAFFGTAIDFESDLINEGFSVSQAKDLLSRWRVGPHVEDTDSSFSMTLFEGVNSSDGFVLAFRGTLGVGDYITDVGDIVADGVALDQIVDLVNMWAWLNSAGVYAAAKLETLVVETALLRAAAGPLYFEYLETLKLRDDVVIDLPTNTVRTVVWQQSDVLFDEAKYRQGSGYGGQIAARGLTVVGHSLGGHLSAAFTRLFSSVGANSLSINGAGFGILGLNGFANNNVSNLFKMLGGMDAFNSGSVLNLYGDKNPEFVTQNLLLQQSGAHVPVFIEQPYPWSNVVGHSVSPIVDTLAIYDLFFRMEKKVQLNGLLTIFNYSSADAATSLEMVVKLLGKVFNIGLKPFMRDDRESLHANIDVIRKSQSFTNVADKVSIKTQVNLNAAYTNFGQFLSLYFALPFVIEGVESDLSNLHADLYTSWSADQNLSAEDRKNGKANFSDEWYQDSATYLQLLMERNKNDIDKLESSDPDGKNGFYIKVVNNDNDAHHIFSGSTDASNYFQNPAAPRIILGTINDNDNATRGGDGNDRIYGLGGDDKLNGLKGNDVLDGGAGKDELLGGEGGDLLLGGAGDDVLNGGEGNDILKGGADNDTYKFTGDFGRDIILDNDGTDVIDIDGVVVGELKQTAKDSLTYTNAAGTVEAVLIDNGDSKSLLINSASNRSNSVTIDNWATGKFGVTLTEANEENASLPHSITGDGNGNQLFPHAEPNKHYSSTEIHGGLGVDFIHGSTSADRLYGEGGDDWITAGANHGKVSSLDSSIVIVPAGGGGKDFIDGGDGDDVISGLADRSEWYGGKGNDMLLGGSVMHMFQLSMPKIDASLDDELLSDMAWRDFSSLLKSGFTIDQEVKDGATIYGYSAWAGIEPGTYTGTSAMGNGWQYRFTFSANPPLEDPSDKNRGVSNYSYLNGADVSWGGNISLDYRHPAFNDGEFTANNLYTQFRLSPKELASGLTKKDVEDRAHLNLHGGEGDDLLLGWYARDEMYGDEGNDALFASDGNDLLDGGEGNDTLAGGWGNDTLLAGEGDDLLIGDDVGASIQGAADVLYGGAGKDTLHGNAGDDYLHGGSGDDDLYGGDGNDYLFGGEGADFLLGDAGDDILVGDIGDSGWGGGQNNDIYIIENVVFTNSELEAAANASPAQNANVLSNITPTAAPNSQPANTISLFDDDGNNTLAIAGATLLEQISLTAQGQDLILRVGNGEIFIVNGLNNTINQIVFGDSAETLVSQAQIGNINTHAVAMDDVIATRLTNDIARTAQAAGGMLVGGLGNDTLTAHAGGSTFLGSKGNDLLIGNSGDDVYVIRANDGQDTITESGGNNKIKFAEGITPEQITLHRGNGNLLVLVATGESITVNGMFNTTTGEVNANNAIQSIEFANKTQWDLTRILQEAEKGITLTGTDYVDVLTAYESNDTLIGGKGNDKLQGDKGDDHYHFDLNHGADTVTDLNGYDRIHLADGISETHVSLRKDTNNNLIIRINNTDSITVTAMFDAQGALTTSAIEEIHFGNTGVWNAERIASELARNQAHVFIGTDSNDALTGDNANQTFVGHKGDDQLNGGAANDTYQYALGDGKDVIQDVNGIDRLQLTGVTENGVVARRVGADLQLTINTSDSITIKNAFDVKAANVVAPGIVSIIEQLQNRWLSQAEALIETHYGLTGSGNMLLEFETDAVGGHAAHVETSYFVGANTSATVKLVIDLADFAELPNGDGYLYYDRIIAHEMVHAVMSRNLNTSVLPGWFNEGVAEFIHGADERVTADLGVIGVQNNFNLLFKTTVGSPGIGAGYSVSYIAVKLLDKEIRDQGGLGIKEVFDQLKAGKTLDQALTIVSAAHGGMSGVWNNLASFESHFLTVGFSLYPTLLNLSDADTGSIAGSDYGNTSLSAESVLPEISTGPTKNFTLVIPEQYIPSPEMNGVLESIGFDLGAEWDLARITQEVLKPTNGDDTIHAFDTDDVLSGSQGNDQLFGYAGNDVYRYVLGDGSDVIVDSAGADQIEFGAGILAAEIELSRDSSNNLIILLKDRSTITVSDAFTVDGELSPNSIESIKFSNGDIWDSGTIFLEANRVRAIVFQGTDESEILYGSDEGDILIGGLGNDVLYGGAGDDVYHYQLGDGNDRIKDPLGINEIKFGDAIFPSEIELKQLSANSLYIKFKDGANIEVGSSVIHGLDIASLRFANGDLWDAAYIKNKVHTGTEVNDKLYGWNDSDSIYGYGGADSIESNGGDDVLTGGAGSDVLWGGEGNDAYHYSIGDGLDTIKASEGKDRLVLDVGISEADVTLQRIDKNNVIVSFLQGGSVLLQNMFVMNGYYSFENEGAFSDLAPIKEIVFNNHVVWDLETIKEKLKPIGSDSSEALHGFDSDDLIHGFAGEDDINGYSGNDTLNGGDGDDRLSGGAGNDQLIGGAGSDSLFGGLGDDSYYLNAEDVKSGSYFSQFTDGDYLRDEGGVDTLYLTENFESDFKFIVDGKSLYFVDENKNYFEINFGNEITEDTLIESVVFADGVTLSIHEILARSKFSTPLLHGHVEIRGETNDVLEGTAGNNRLWSAGGDDTYYAGLGVDTLYGGDGDDRYIIKAGDGYKLIGDSGGNDVIQFGAGIDPEDLMVSKNGDYLYFYNRKGQFIVVEDWSSLQKIERVEFEGGDVWDSAIIQQKIESTQLIPNFVTQENISYNSFTTNQHTGVFIAAFNAVTVTGGNGDDTIVSAKARDTVHMYGGAGRDSFIINQGGPKRVRDFDVASDFLVFSDVYKLHDLDFQVSNYYIGNSQVSTLNIYDQTGNSSALIGSAVVSYLKILNPYQEPELYGDGFSTLSQFIVLANGEKYSFSDLLKANLQITDGDDDLRLVDDADNIDSGLGNDYINGGAGDDTLNGGEGNDNIFGGMGNDQIEGGNHNDHLKGSYGNDYISGGNGFDTLSGGYGIDTLIGGAGDDMFYAYQTGNVSNSELSDTTYIYRLGDGNDTILDWAGDDKLIFDQGIAAADVAVERIDSDLLIKIHQGGSILIKDSLLNGVPALGFIEKIEFFGGLTWDKGTIVAKISGIDNVPPPIPTAEFNSVGSIVMGYAEANSLVEVKSSNGLLLGSGTADSNSGAYTITLATALINNETVNVTAKDTTGNISIAKSILAPDLTAPLLPTANFDATGKVISGFAEAGSIVAIKNANNTSSLGTVTAHATTGAYSITLATALINKETVNITATDAAGNVSLALPVVAPDVAAPNPSPLIIQAENYTSMSGVQKENTSDVGGGQNTGYIDAGDWMAYNNAAFNVPAEGRYRVTYRVASLNGGGQLTLKELSTDAALGSISIPKTSGWQTWVDVTQEITLSGGEHNFKLAADIGGFNINWFKLEPLAPVAPDITPPVQPTAGFDSQGKIITGIAEAGSVVVVKNANNTSTLGTVTADATTGAYSITLATALINKETVNITATDAAGNVSVARVVVAPDVAAPNPSPLVIQAENYTSMSGVQTENTSDAGGGLNAGWLDGGDWMAYNNAAFKVPAEGRYRVTYRIASLNGGGRLTLKELSTDAALGSVSIPKTSGWQTWVDVTQEITLSGGEHNFKLAVDVGGFNVNWFKLEPLEPTASVMTPLAKSSAMIDWQDQVTNGIAAVGNVVAVSDVNNTGSLGTVTAESIKGVYEPAVIAAEVSRLKTDYESVHYVSSNDVLIQAMASFVSGTGVDTRYRSTNAEQSPLMIAVGS
ncbi:MAG: flagellinolysin [Candidatus Saccharibacteria bacterium]|nr:flagellinolysin [Candidatus Saccharibacteria bacterium]